jgi:hypothetical protein
MKTRKLILMLLLAVFVCCSVSAVIADDIIDDPVEYTLDDEGIIDGPVEYMMFDEDLDDPVE